MTLDMARRGQTLRIAGIPDGQIRAQAIRFGIAEGSTVICDEVIPAGPIVLRKNRQQIALGRKLASSILIDIIGA